MKLDEQVAKIAGLIGDKTRSAILIALMEGKALTAGELALCANISPQTASNHLKKLLEADLIELVKTPTRYRYFKISSSLVANAIESLSLLSPEKNVLRGMKNLIHKYVLQEPVMIIWPENKTFFCKTLPRLDRKRISSFGKSGQRAIGVFSQ